MKLIHCADLHLDSPMEANLSPEKARERKGEILATFSKMVRVASEGGVEAILIAGDLFDSDHITKRTERYVLDLIASYPEIAFFYLAGNHDKGNAIRFAEARPENLYTFDDSWTSYTFGEVTVTGSERPDPETLMLDPNAQNIVLMHGQERSAKGVSAENAIRFSLLKNKHIDYLALGHLHEYRTAAIDSRCTACYSGCLEGRGFDECGQKGYVLLETTGKGIMHSFVPMARRTMHTVACDISGFASQVDLENRLMDAVSQIPPSDLVKVELVGSCPIEQLKDTAHLAALLSDRFYFAKINDRSKLLIDPDSYRSDISLKGEFVRRVMASNMKEDEKARVIACGFRALAGEEVGF